MGGCASTRKVSRYPLLIVRDGRRGSQAFITNSVKVVVPRSGCSFGAVGGLAGRWSEPSPRPSMTMRELNEESRQSGQGLKEEGCASMAMLH